MIDIPTMWDCKSMSVMLFNDKYANSKNSVDAYNRLCLRASRRNMSPDEYCWKLLVRLDNFLISLYCNSEVEHD